jgi:hypothetical protein
VDVGKLNQCLGSDKYSDDIRKSTSEAHIVERVVFIFRAVVGDALHDFLRVVAAGEGAFRLRPITFRLAAVSGDRMTSDAVAYVPRSRG